VEVGDGAMEGSEEAGWKKGEDYGRSFRPLYFIDDFFWYFGCADEIASILDVQRNFFGILDVQMKLRISFVLGTDQ
jgi:hypothetical protein